jgi:hypothetical protein
MTFPCIRALYPKLAHPFHFSPFYLSPLLMVSSTGLKILYSFLYRKYITHIHFLDILNLWWVISGCNPRINWDIISIKVVFWNSAKTRTLGCTIQPTPSSMEDSSTFVAYSLIFQPLHPICLHFCLCICSSMHVEVWFQTEFSLTIANTQLTHIFQQKSSNET